MNSRFTLALATCAFAACTTNNYYTIEQSDVHRSSADALMIETSDATD